MDVWKEMVQEEKKPTEDAEKIRYDAERLASLAVVEIYHLMIEEGLLYAVLANVLVQILHVPYDDSATLLFHVCDPGREVDKEDLRDLQEPTTSMARELCLCL